jgi:hydrogenase maturation protease
MPDRVEDNKINDPTLIIGVGTEYGDDTFGLLVARCLQHNPPKNTRIVEHSGEGASLMELWRGLKSVIIIDVSESGSPVGSQFRFDVSTEKIPARFFRYSTHHFSVAEAIETARALGMLPDRMIVFGVEGKVFYAGSTMSTELLPLISEFAGLVKTEIEKF